MKLSLIAAPVLALLAGCSALGSSSDTTEFVYVVEASGGAWSAATKAREAMESFDQIETLHMSGARAVFQLESGAEISEDDLATAFEEKGMKLELFDEEKRPRAKWMYAVDSGITWAGTAGKVRAALIEKTGALDVYFEEEIEVLVVNPETFSVPDLEDALDELEVEYTEIEEVETR